MLIQKEYKKLLLESVESDGRLRECREIVNVRMFNSPPIPALRGPRPVSRLSGVTKHQLRSEEKCRTCISTVSDIRRGAGRALTPRAPGAHGPIETYEMR
ncbi:hypothetical protein EVAR_14633_1 [Eumeta japonica]|uniref:Uncharacterized protein n=1 Tax=Eumeta variegata TaxID=151549 RepID=A0A4C1U2V3_EUMVA|nr:hypothetical protein EVAR_14633_1 [Eumeta japonica]